MRLPVRDEVTEIEYHRQPTPFELKQGYGATHYATFTVEECCHPCTRIPKQRFTSPYDGLRYYYR